MEQSISESTSEINNMKASQAAMQSKVELLSKKEEEFKAKIAAEIEQREKLQA